MDMWILIVGGIIIGLGLIFRFISKKTGYDFNDKRFFKAPKIKDDVALNPNNPIGDEI